MDPYAQGRRPAAPVARLAVRIPIRRGRHDVRRRATAPRTRRSPPSSTRRSRGATIGRCARRGTRRSSTSCTSRASRRCIPTFPKRCAAPISGLATEPAIRHLTSLGVTAVELMPVHHHARRPAPREARADELLGLQHARLLRARRRATRRRASPLECVREFKMMVRALHAAGLEVILDVVYNHTAEGNHLGPTLSLRGIDNASYYRLLPHAPRYYVDFTGCGNTLNMQQPAGAAADHGQPALLGDGDARRRVPLRPRERAGSRVVRRGQARRVLRHHSSGPGAVAGEADRRAVGPRRGRLPGRQLSGAVDRVERQVSRHGAALLERRRRRRLRARDAARRAAAISTRRAAGGRTRASTSSPRTTASRLRISSATTTKHNEANGEENRDGENHNLSWNCGVEGPTDDRRVIELRARQQRNLIATLLLSQGVPMISGGDELGRTQQGNNNAYCQDNEISWTDWDLTPRAAGVPRVRRSW